MLGDVAEFEREVGKERTVDGMKAAKNRRMLETGKLLEQRPKFTRELSPVHTNAGSSVDT